MKRLALLAIVAVLFFTVARAQELHRRPSADERIQKLEHEIGVLQRKVYALCGEYTKGPASKACDEQW